MAAVLTLVRTPPGPESCSFSESDETPEIPVDEGDREGPSGLISSGMEVTFGMGYRRPEAAVAPPIGYHGRLYEPTRCFE
jgi:hypothetical protein